MFYLTIKINKREINIQSYNYGYKLKHGSTVKIKELTKYNSKTTNTKINRIKV